MTYVITDACIDVKDQSCIEVCPVDCIHPMKDEAQFEEVQQLYIDPEECIDCDACVDVCPVGACVADDALSPEQQPYLKINADFFAK
jgi:NAD-dependent dihydropyrimidine dehydrogenase PreA subunit